MKITRGELRKIIKESFPGDGPGPGYRGDLGHRVMNYPGQDHMLDDLSSTTTQAALSPEEKSKKEADFLYGLVELIQEIMNFSMQVSDRRLRKQITSRLLTLETRIRMHIV